MFGDIVPKYVGAAIVTLELEVPVVGSQPAVDNLDDFDPTAPEPQSPRRLVSSVAGVAIHVKIEHGDSQLSSSLLAATSAPPLKPSMRNRAPEPGCGMVIVVDPSEIAVPSAAGRSFT